MTVAEEFLTLLIYILSERFTPGVGQVSEDEAVKREIIHQLCIQPMAHSELTKALPEDVSIFCFDFHNLSVHLNFNENWIFVAYSTCSIGLLYFIVKFQPNHETGIEDAVHKVANFK